MERNQVIYQVSTVEYEAARKEASLYFLSVSQWAKYQAFPSEIFTLLGTMRKRISTFTNGKQFYVRNCFLSQDWKNFPRGLKASLGSKFFNQVNEGLVPGVSYVKQDSSDVAVYRIDQVN